MTADAKVTVKTPLSTLFLTVLLLLMCGAAVAQSSTYECNGDCTGNCAPDNRPLGTKIEKGCECFDGLDNDGDTRGDRFDTNCASYYGLTYVGEGSDCNLPVSNTGMFTGVQFSGSSSQNTADTQSKVSVGDVDGDGIPDAVITSKWNSKLTVVATRVPQPDGTKLGAAKAEWNLSGQGENPFKGFPGDCAAERLMFEHENLIADIDKNGTAEIFAVVSNRDNAASTVPPKCFYLIGFRYVNGNLEVIPGWGGLATSLGPDRPGTFGIADMDGDGKAEIYLRDHIYAAETGKLLATGNGDWDVDVSAGPVAVDIKHLQADNGKMELVVGPRIYGIPNLTNRTPAAPANLSLLKDMNSFSADKAFVKMCLDPVEYGEDTHSMTSVGDINRDGEIDVIISGALNSTGGKTAVFAWDVKNNKTSTFIVPDPDHPNGWPWGTGRVNIGDADGDGDPEFSFIAGDQLFCLTLDASGNLVQMWKRDIYDTRSGVLTVTIYDFNSDGNPEMVYRDSQELVIIDGKTGATKLWSTSCQSHTYTEGPIIADVNGDGVTDICVTCFTGPGNFDIDGKLQQQALGQVRLFYSNSTIAWAATRKVWNQPGYFVVNINDDLTLPFPQIDQNLVFPGGTCATGVTGPLMRLNVFLNQVPFLTSSGCPIVPAPDLTIAPQLDQNGNIIKPAVEVIPPVCGNYEIKVKFNMQNIGDLPITDNIPVTFYNGNPYTAGTATKLYTTTIPITNLGIDQYFQYPPAATDYVTFNGPGSEFTLYVVLNDKGLTLPINTGTGATNECKITNNFYTYLVTPTPYSVVGKEVKPNFVCTSTGGGLNGEAAVDYVQKGTQQVTDFSLYNFQWYSGTPGNLTPITNGSNYNAQGLDGGTYYVVATHKTLLCASPAAPVVVGETSGDITWTYNKKNQTKCTPLDGEVEAVDFSSSILGATLTWISQQSGVEVAEGVTKISGLLAGAYSLEVERDGCKSFQNPVTITGPSRPDGLTSSTDQQSCVNPVSGQISVQSYIPGTTNTIDPDQSKYSFRWFQYNGANTPPRGTEVAPVSTAATRSVPVGTYEAVITDITTNCVSNSLMTAVVGNTLLTPTADILPVQDQTSCDPNAPNGIFRGVALENGVAAADQSKYQFHWFKGQNTLNPAHKVSLNGATDPFLNNVSGNGQIWTLKVINSTSECSGTSEEMITEMDTPPTVTLARVNNTNCPTAIAANGSVTATVMFDGGNVSTNPNNDLVFTWHLGSTLTGVSPTPNSTTNVLSQRSANTFTLQVEHPARKCKSEPVTIQVLDVLDYPDLLIDTDPSTNCTTPAPGAAPNGVATILEVDATAVPAAGTLAPYSFQWYTGATATVGNEIPGGNVGFVNGLQGFGDYAVKVVNTTTTCTTVRNIQIQDASIAPLIALTPFDNGICDASLTLPLVNFSGRVEGRITNFAAISDPITDYQFSWTNTTTNTAFAPVMGTGAPIADGDVLSRLDDGVYRLVVKNLSTGCQSSPSTAEVKTTVTGPSIDAIPQPSTNCPPVGGNGEVELTEINTNPPSDASNANFRIRWYAGSNISAPFVANTALISNIQGSPTAFYTVQVINNATGCQTTSTEQVADFKENPVITLTQNPNTFCENFNGQAIVNSITYQGNTYDPVANAANLAYTWYDGTGTTTPHATQPLSGTLGGLENGKFVSATVTLNDIGCTSNYVAVEIQDGRLYPVVDAEPTASTNCVGGVANGSAIINGVAPVGDSYEFYWYTGNTVGAPGSETNNDITDRDITNLQGSPSAFHTAMVKSATTKCTSTEVVLVLDESMIPVLGPLTPADNTNCATFPDGSINGPNGTVTMSTLDYDGGAVAPAYAGYTFRWTGPATNQTGANLPQINGKGAGVYTLVVTQTATNCISDPVTATVGNALVYPLLSNALTPQTSCDEINFPNGQITSTATVASGPSGFAFEWFTGAAVSGTSVTETATDGQTTADLRSGDYTVRVYNTTTACASTETVVLPDLITYPVLTWGGVNHVAQCGPAPDGAATPVASNVSNPVPGGMNFTLFYVETREGINFPTDPAVVKTGTSENSTDITLSAVTNVFPGYITGLIVDNNTKCESQPVTVEIENNVIDLVYTLVGKEFATPCGPGLDGGIDIEVSGGTGSYQFEWYLGVPSNTNINFFDNKPDMTSAVLQNAGNLTIEDLGKVAPPEIGFPAAGVQAGVYTVVVTDLGNQCGIYKIESVPLTESPTLTVTPTDVTTCAPTGNGALQVTVTESVAANGPYELKIYSGNNGSTPALESQGSSDNFVVTKNLLNAGEYYIELVDRTPDGLGGEPNAPCPVVKSVRLDKTVFNPLVSLALTAPNTSCDPANSADGKITITAKKQSNDTSPVQTPQYNASIPGFTNFTLEENVALLKPGFAPGTYSVTVTNILTQCVGSASIPVADQPLIPPALDVEATPDTWCAPSTNGKLEVRNVTAGDFQFTWSDVPDMASALFGPSTNLIYQNGVAGWKTADADHTYYVRGKRIAAADGRGIGCLTPIVMRVVADDHVIPQLTLSSTPNTACVGSGEGTVSALATTTTSEVAVQNATYSFELVGIDAATGGHAANANFLFPTKVNENGGTPYSVIAINQISNCQTTGTVTVDQFRYPLEIIQRTIKNQLICDFDGEIQITDIRFDNNDPAQTYDPADYSFEWFKAPTNAPGTFDVAAPLRDNNNNIIATDLITQGTTNGTYSQMEAGAYYVIAKRNIAVGEGCPTPPYRIDLIDQHQNPTIALVPFTDTSCDGTGEGAIQVNVTADATNVAGPFTYGYSWNPNTLAGNNPTGLVAGDYSVIVTNNETKCVVSAATTITMNQTPVFVTSATPTHKLFCTPAQEKIVVDGVEVQLPDGTQVPSIIADYDYTWEREAVGVLTPVTETLQLSNYPNIGAGVYFVSAKRMRATDGGPGMGCSSAPYRVEILNNVSLPNVTLTPAANTACSQDAAIFEGSISIQAFDNTGPGVGSAYNYAWTPADATNNSNITLLNGPGTGETQANLRDDSYTIRVTNQTTGCFVDAETSITKSELPVVVVEALASPKLFCKPDGAAVEVTTIEVGGTVDNDPSDYDFVWYEGDATDANIIPGVSNAMILNSTNYPTITNNSLKYFVKVVRSNTATPARGRGCMSPIVEVNIPDLSVNPTLALDATPNSHCTATNAIVEATASEVTGGPAALYNFVWKLGDADLPNGTTPTVNAGNLQTLNNAPEGTYLIAVTNATTNCSIDQEVVVIRDLMISLPNIINVTPTRATDCAETGSAEVTQIMIGGVPTVDPPSNPRFSYKWYGAYPGPILKDQNSNDIVTYNLPGALAGTYFVTLVDGNTSCESTPKEVIIDKCLDCLPSVVITQTAPQINCNDNGKDFTGALFAVASNNAGSPRTDFVFTWYNNLDATGTVFNGTDTDQLLNLPDGNFSVSILDETTQCMATNYYIIQNDAALFMPKLLLTPAGRQNCLVADGGVLIQQTADVNPLTSNYPFDPYTPGYTITVLENRAGAVSTTPTPSVDPTALTWFQSGLDTLNSYVVTILDPNTGCDDTQEIQIPSMIQKPVIELEIDQPLTNCSLFAPNGQLSATADGGFVTGYSFEWFTGNPATGSAIGNQNKLIGVGSPGQLTYTVSVTNDVTGCVRTAPAVLTMDLKYPVTPEAHTMQHMTRCDNPPDGWVTASVEGQTAGYSFYWFDENVLGQNYESLIASREPEFPDYFERPAGTYTAIVQDIYSGCPAADTAVVEDRRRYPELLFKTTASFCEDVPGEFSNNKGNGTIEMSLSPSDIVAQDITWEKELPPYPVTSMIGSYIVDLYPGKYFVHVVTSSGCEVDGEEIVPTDIQSYNLITQNQDGKNDRFVIDCISRFPNNNVKIFNRSGVLVYEANNYDNDGVVFDGMGKNGIYMTGNVLPVGTYFYIIDKGDNSKPRTGYLELVR